MTVLSRDTERGVPTLVWARKRDTTPTQDTPQAAARASLEQQASLYGLSAADLESVYVHRVHDSGRGGIIVFFRQRVGGLEVANTELKVLLGRDLELVALTGNLRGGVAQQAVADFTFPASEAVLRALGDVHGLSLVGEVQALGLSHEEDASRFDLAPGGAIQRAGLRLVTPARVTRLYFPVGGRLVPAYAVDHLSVRAGDERPHGQVHVLHAGSGEVLLREDRVASDAYSYRVWAHADGTPADNPQVDFSPHPTGRPEDPEPGFATSRRVTVEGRTHPGTGRVDPWLPSGAEATWGNNVRAYADHFDPDGYTDGQDRRAQVTAGTRDFPHVYDSGAGPMSSVEQVSASVVQLFYTTNWLHDYFYDSGFTEAAGNAQDVNRGPGGLGGDPVLAEAQNRGPDPQARNLALAYVPRDGMSPRLEFSLWQTAEERAFTASGTRYETGKAEFGAQRIDEADRPLIVASDGTGTASDACEPLQNDVTGAIVLADRGSCIYELKAVNAEAAQAAGLIVINNVPGDPPPEMTDVDATLTTGLPVLSVSYEAGQALKDLLTRGSVTGTMLRVPHPERDSSLDNTIVAHEWGHILSQRLITPCSTPQCRALGEGWSDFLALHLMVREEDNASGTYAIGGHAAQLSGQSAYFGVRRTPYSRDFARNAFQLRHLSNAAGLPAQDFLRDNGLENSQIHNAGEVWASMLFEAYQALLDETRQGTPRIATFAEARRRMADYAVAGMMLTPGNATLTEQRDALLLAAATRDTLDMQVLARAFARRGAGTCAVSPARDSRDFSGIVEDLTAHADVRLESVRVTEAGHTAAERSCDGDGVLDASETGLLKIAVRNHGPFAAKGATVRVFSDDAPLSFPGGTTFSVAEVAPFGSGEVQVPIALAATLTSFQTLRYRVVLESGDACQRRVEQAHSIPLHYDLSPSTTDKVEGLRTTWRTEVLGGDATQAWRVTASPLTSGEKLWFAADGYDFADTVLETPALVIPSGSPFVLAFTHRHWFDYSEDARTGVIDYWNGGVIEYHVEGEAPDAWHDILPLASPGYAGPLDTQTGNPLGGRRAYAARNPRWPQPESVTLDFGTSLSGKTVKLRFRLGSSVVFRAHGWEVDDITAQGTASPPFLERVADSTSPCVPLAQAGEDQSVLAGDTTTLDGSRSTDPGAAPLTFLWTQVSGPPVELRDANTATPSFTAPGVSQDTVLEFELTVQVAGLTATDLVRVTARPQTSGPDAGEPDAGPTPDAGPIEPPKRPGEHTGCTSVGGAGLAWPLGLLGALLLTARRRRRS
ncbi:M36 family metallopeptidase [Myxococcus qinghaiensis]|uniref:M36 family metallopeptidase n=1 Tax=Myxococcus qinghaiensis TaxID=2906758 RepID=UPI0020A70F74|nr:M36 family metallopeptidase [Myxococcus qinghaiensis]MCP3164499.1 M36 family metallopeptidase [Myxococcus qinghaiensis]